MSPVNVISPAVAAVERWVRAARRRWTGFDHFWRALDRYGEVLAGRLAAAIAYYGFFAVFALGLVAYWIFGAILGGGDEVSDAAADYLKRNLPFLDPAQVEESSGNVGVIGLVLLAFTGIGWVEAIRSSQRIMYGLNQQPGNLVVRRLVDLAVLVGVFVLLGVSVGAVDALESLLWWLFGGPSIGSTISGWVLAVVVNIVLAAALLVAVPRLRMTARRVWPSVLLVALGITLLNTVGHYFVLRAERNPAYAVVRGAVGLLLYLYLLNQLLLLGAALAATSRHGRVVDLAGGPGSMDGEAEPSA
jgi:membrane protein